VNIDPHFVNDLTPVIGLSAWDRDDARRSDARHLSRGSRGSRRA
jgi:hypothetical protein